LKELAALNPYLLKYKWMLLWGMFFVALSNIFSILPAQFVKYAIDLVSDAYMTYPTLKGSGLESAFYDSITYDVLLFGAAIVGLAIMRGFLLFYMRQTIIVMSRKIEYDQKSDLYSHFQSLPLSFYRRNNTGDLMARISEDLSKVRMYVGPAIMYGINLVVSFVVVVSYMLTVDVKLTLFSLAPLPLLSIMIYYVNSIINKRSEGIQNQLSAMSTYTQEAFSGIRVLKAYTRELFSAQKFQQEALKYQKLSLSLVIVNALFAPVMTLMIGMSTVLVVYIGGHQVISGEVTPGVIGEFIIYINLLTWPVTALGWVASTTQTAEASQKRINELLKQKNDIVSIKNIKKDLQGQIEFKDVEFVYPDTGIKALQGISFSLKKGESLAILGSTGSGKSTIANLVSRLYDVSGGEILIDGINIKDFNIQNLRSQIGYVPQDVFLFSDTIRANIGFGKENPTEEEIVLAAKQAAVYENIMSFPAKFDTMLGERGITLSGGQKQRVSIARALIRKPAIMILDDCLSAVDTKTEKAILTSLSSSLQECTSIIISHRVSAAMLATRILVLDQGKVVQMGTHNQLIEQEGFYKELYEKQIKEIESSVS
jgi:ATP-binding cassette subfamily B protein